MRGMDTDQSAKLLLEGQKIHYNYLRPHQALNGKTPAEKAGIDLQLKGNKWKELIARGKMTKQRQKPDNHAKSQGEDAN